jgi:NAD(P)-dependent dehydrogenase (short-subunit alcohol dehydrogenase family)
MQISGKVALITGGKRIGAAVAAALAGRGADIVLSYRASKEETERIAADVRASGGRASIFEADLTRVESCEGLVAHAVQQFGRLDLLINMASLYVSKPFDQLTPDDLDRNLMVDLRGAYLCARAAVPHMRAVGGGRIVNFSDWVAASGRPRYPGYLTYYVSKMAVIGLTQGLALELAPDNILVNAIAPGPILAPAGLPASELEAVERATPLGRWGGEGEIAKAVLSLIESDFITGETVRVDGGRHLK